MHLTPSEAFEHIKESMIEYLETAYKIAHPAIFAERGELLRQRGVVAQAPFIESTPAFPPARKLVELEFLFPNSVSSGLATLMQHGVPVDRFPLYTHQEEALLAATGDRPNLLVATGTGSGKTESFVLPILNDLLREAPSWTPVTTQALPGRFDFTQKLWLHSRRHEQRPAAMRGIILYPMNALVNDQLSRLRRILARGTSPDWQKQHWQGNVIHFGMYTGLSQPTGHWSNKSKRSNLEKYLQKIHADWEKLREDLRDTGNWPRPDSPEMLCRWDMQAAPPDILVTNYSMLEYMLVRPIEASIFDQTRQWLKTTPGACLTLVLDEAHTYTGAKGTEVAYLVRRLKERLGLSSGSPQFRAIATTASVPPGANEHLLQFVSDLFGEPQDRFTLIQVGSGAQVVPERRASSRALFAFERFHQSFSLTDPKPAITQLATDLGRGPVEDHLPPQVSLYNLLIQNHDIQWSRQRTARRATLLNRLADECWPELATPDRRERATAGVLSAGSFARAEALPDTPPLISVRMHIFFRGIYGLWACMDPNCPKASPLPPGITSRPVGKLFMDPRPWCECGARVLELFSCRHCGLLYLGGIPDSAQGSFWPWSDDLSGDRVDFRQFHIFGVEAPDAYSPREYRSTRTTLHTHPEDVYARPVYPFSSEGEDERPDSNFPNICPRCRNYREMRENGREIIEPLRTKGPRAFSILAEDGFRVQPRATHGDPPNYGRKTLLFTDSRQEAAQLAADLRDDHHNDVFRQLIYRSLMICPECQGEGSTRQTGAYRIGQGQTTTIVSCSTCQGTGIHPHPQMLPFQDVRSRVLQFQLDRGIDPTNGTMNKFFTQSDQGYAPYFAEAEKAFYVALRRELSEKREFALEPLGLACWRVRLPEQTGAFPNLSEDETRLFLQAVTRILATEKILLPPEPFKPWEWPNQVKDYERNVLIRGFKRDTDQGKVAIPYNLSANRKLGRYVIAVSQALVSQKRLPSNGAAKQWVHDLELPLWDALKAFHILSVAGRKFGVNEKVPFGIRIDVFDLFPLGETIQRCNACAYIMGETLFHVCLRCGQQTSTVSTSSIQSFYRRAALHALPGSHFDDPYPLRAAEHTAQIPGREARDEERWFQDLFHDHQHPFDYRVDVLSVTTTMEMGIDIGSLLNVGMRNIPPTVANYQQRAGRAGRRGSALATVLSFAQFRSHDQYYFAHPPEIVSFPPRVPALYLANEVIARRHVRSLLLQSFFYFILRKQQLAPSSNLFEAWGKVADFTNMQGATRLRGYLTTNRDMLLKRCQQIVEPEFVPRLGAWMGNLVNEVQQVLNLSDVQESILNALIHAGLLPKYAFPVDVVSLFIPSEQTFSNDIESNDDAMQRDLKIALGEYAPGAEIIKQEFPNTYIYRSVGVYERYNANPDYSATGMLVECTDCQSVTLVQNSDEPPDQCEECGSLLVTPLPYLRPKGFTVDCALPNQGRERYQRGGRERSGSVQPAKLMVGQTSFQTGTSQQPFAPHLYIRVRQGELFTCNKGPNPDFPGFLICPVCGRALDPDHQGSHTYPANVPPFRGKNAGPQAGTLCPNTTDRNQVILGHRFFSEIILLGVDLPETLDAPFQAPSGKAVWYSFGILVANAAALILQIDQAELQVGVRAVRRTPGNRLHGEVFLYDNVPGGAGYARAIEQNLETILRKALELGDTCPNPDCQGACYHCMFDYRNQTLHPLLDRRLGTALLRFLLYGNLPNLDAEQVKNNVIALAEYAQMGWTILPEMTLDGQHFPLILRDPDGTQVGLWVIHPLQARPTREERQAFLSSYGLRCAVHTTFDLERRPFWVLNNLTW